MNFVVFQLKFNLLFRSVSVEFKISEFFSILFKTQNRESITVLPVIKILFWLTPSLIKLSELDLVGA